MPATITLKIMVKESVIFRNAAAKDIPQIWKILQQAIFRRKLDGSNQWQDGYPNLQIVENDIKRNIGFVLANAAEIIGYCAVLINDEPVYDAIHGKWLTCNDFVVVHRIAIADKYLKQGYADAIFEEIEKYAVANNIFSLKADTNFDNPAMLHLFEKRGFVYCGEVFFRKSPRKAFEKRLTE